jgi:nucleoside-diphosphate-sugar epimerase
MTRVLVTGASGCVGRAMLPQLVRRGWDVHAVTRREPPPSLEGVTWHRADLLDPAQVYGCVRAARASHLMHLAWFVAPGAWPASPENLRWVAASLGLLEAFQRSGGVRVVTAGTCHEYDWSFGCCSEESTPREPRTMYGTCKHALERLTRAFAEQSGVTSAWGRIFFLYGPHEHQDRLVPSVIRSLLAGEPARCSHGEQVRDYLFVEDVSAAMVQLLESGLTGPINIASGQEVRLRDIVTRIGALLGRPELIQLGAIPPATFDVPLVVADVTRLTKELAWHPSVTLDAGLLKTIDWWQSRAMASGAAESSR